MKIPFYATGAFNRPLKRFKQVVFSLTSHPGQEQANLEFLIETDECELHSLIRQLPSVLGTVTTLLTHQMSCSVY